MLQDSTPDYVMCDSEELYDPLHNKIQKMKNKLSFFFSTSILTSNNEAKNWEHIPRSTVVLPCVAKAAPWKEQCGTEFYNKYSSQSESWP